MVGHPVIITDMDGSLLNHQDYRYDAVLPCLKELQQQSVAVVLNSSKTRAELADWVDKLQLSHPFVTENGSAIFSPSGYFDAAIVQPWLRQHALEFRQLPGYDIIELGTRIEKLQAFVDEQTPNAIDFSRCSLNQAVDITGLSRDDARLAQQREYSLPLLFAQATEEKDFSEQALAAGFNILKGGRFLHLLGKTDKGRSVQWLRELYRQQRAEPVQVIALGDSANDAAMLQQADIAVLVHNPEAAPFGLYHPQLIKTIRCAPEGWVEGVESALSMNS